MKSRSGTHRPTCSSPRPTRCSRPVETRDVERIETSSRRRFDRARIGFACGLLMCGLLVAEGHAEAPSDARCERVSLAEPLPWISSAVRSPYGEQIIVTSPSSPTERRIFGLSPRGDLLWKRIGGGDLPFSVLSMPAAGGDKNRGRYLAAMANSDLRWVDGNLRPLPGVPPVRAKAESQDGLVVHSFFERHLAVDQWLVGFGALEPSSGTATNYVYGFIAQHLDPTTSREQPPVVLISPLNEREPYYRVGHQYITTVGRLVYFIELGPTPALYRFDLGNLDMPARYLEGLPGSRDLVPDFDESALNYDFARIFSTLETFHGLPVGIYSQGPYLAVLYRPSAAGEAWRLVSLRPRENHVEVVRDVRIDSSAPHLSILPGPRVWTVFERGVVDSGGGQTTASILRVPKQVIIPDRVHTKPGTPSPVDLVCGSQETILEASLRPE